MGMAGIGRQAAANPMELASDGGRAARARNMAVSEKHGRVRRISIMGYENYIR